MIRQAQAEFPQLSLVRLCQLLGVSRSWFYRVQHAARADDPDTESRSAIEKLVLQFPRYGYRRVTAALQRDGWIVNRKRVLRIMREESLLCQLKRRWIATTNSNHSLGI